MIYLLDTNVITDLIEGNQTVRNQLLEHKRQKQSLGLCTPIYYEVQRGLVAANLIRKQRVFAEAVLPRLTWIGLIEVDWIQAIQFWADARRKGRQMSDIDVLLATIAIRLDAVIVSSDGDFDALPVRRENWRAR